MMKPEMQLTAAQLQPQIDRLWDLAAPKIKNLFSQWDASRGAPVFTQNGVYTSRGWTEWTQGFQFGSPLLVYEATGDDALLSLGLENTVQYMAPHVTHFGVHDHGFNNVSTYGNLYRLLGLGRLPKGAVDKQFLEMALRASSAVQAARWTQLDSREGYIYSFNGPHSLFADTLRSLRILAVGHRLGHKVLGEQDQEISLLRRLVQHGLTTAKYTVYYGEGRDAYDVPGRVVHESIFNTNNGAYRCPSTQQGYSPFTTWTRGLAWVICGFAEQLEYLQGLDGKEGEGAAGSAASSGSLTPEESGVVKEAKDVFLKALKVAADFYLREMPLDGVPYWDTGAPGLEKLENLKERPADPFNDYEPVDSSAGAIAAQGLLRLGRLLGDEGDAYWQAGLTVMKSLLQEPYLSADLKHQGILLHSIYHRPNGWDYQPEGSKIPRGEACQWGDYHLLEAALYLQKINKGEQEYRFYSFSG